MDIKKTNTPDADLITEYLKGSETSLEKLINRHQLQISLNFVITNIENMRDIGRQSDGEKRGLSLEQKKA